MSTTIAQHELGRLDQLDEHLSRGDIDDHVAVWHLRKQIDRLAVDAPDEVACRVLRAAVEEMCDEMDGGDR